MKQYPYAMLFKKRKELERLKDVPSTDKVYMNIGPRENVLEGVCERCF